MLFFNQTAPAASLARNDRDVATRNAYVHSICVCVEYMFAHAEVCLVSLSRVVWMYVYTYAYVHKHDVFICVLYIAYN